MRSNDEKRIEEAWVEVLAYVYKAVDWKKVARNRSAYDIFEHRLEFSKYEPDIPSVIQKLCNSLSLQAPPLPLEEVDFLRCHEKLALKLLRKMPKLLTLKAADRAKQLKRGQKKLIDKDWEEIEKELLGGE